jgi:hypothetical protein
VAVYPDPGFALKPAVARALPPSTFKLRRFFVGANASNIADVRRGDFHLPVGDSYIIGRIDGAREVTRRNMRAVRRGDGMRHVWTSPAVALSRGAEDETTTANIRKVARSTVSSISLVLV